MPMGYLHEKSFLETWSSDDLWAGEIRYLEIVFPLHDVPISERAV